MVLALFLIKLFTLTSWNEQYDDEPTTPIITIINLNFSL
jgi:hypothetical protein